MSGQHCFSEAGRNGSCEGFGKCACECVDCVAVRSSEQRHEYRPRVAPDSDELLGTTERTSTGYWIEVRNVIFESMGRRIRICLYREKNFVKHFDLTFPLLSMLLPILQRAYDQGSSTRSKK